MKFLQPVRIENDSTDDENAVVRDLVFARVRSTTDRGINVVDLATVTGAIR